MKTTIRIISCISIGGIVGHLGTHFYLNGDMLRMCLSILLLMLFCLYIWSRSDER